MRTIQPTPHSRLPRAASLAVLALAGAATLTTAAPKPPKPAAKAAAPAARPMGFRPAALDLAPGETYPVELYIPGTRGKKPKASLSYRPAPGLSAAPASGWSGVIPPAGVKQFPKVTAAPDASGTLTLDAVLDNGKKTTLAVNVVRPQVELIPLRSALGVLVTNPFRSRVMTGRVLAANEDRFLQDVTAREFRLAPGETGEVWFPLPGAAPVEGESYDFTLTVETYAGYRERTTHPVMFPPQEEKVPLLPQR